MFLPKEFGYIIEPAKCRDECWIRELSSDSNTFLDDTTLPVCQMATWGTKTKSNLSKVYWFEFLFDVFSGSSYCNKNPSELSYILSCPLCISNVSLGYFFKFVTTLLIINSALLLDDSIFHFYVSRCFHCTRYKNLHLVNSP